MLRDRLKYAIRPFTAKPWNSPVMEFRYGLWMGVSALFSESGRQLGEENTRPMLLNHHIPAETHACKYAGSRNGRLINMSALRIAMQNFDAALNITRAVGQYHYAHLAHMRTSRQQPAKPDALGIWDLYLLSRASIAIIAYQQRYRAGPKPAKAIRDTLASQYQFISGVFMVCRDMFDNGDPLIKNNNIVSAQQLYDYADERGIFISFNGMACAGSVKKITEFLEFCTDIEPAKDGDAQQEMTMANLVADADNWYRYAVSTVELDCFIEAEVQRRKIDAPPPEKNRLEKSRATYQALASHCLQLLGQADGGDTGNARETSEEFESGILRRQNEILTLLQRPAVSRLSQKHLAARLGL